jgi:hypothetical protein
MDLLSSFNASCTSCFCSASRRRPQSGIVQRVHDTQLLHDVDILHYTAGFSDTIRKND